MPTLTSLWCCPWAECYLYGQMYPLTWSWRGPRPGEAAAAAAMVVGMSWRGYGSSEKETNLGQDNVLTCFWNYIQYITVPLDGWTKDPLALQDWPFLEYRSTSFGHFNAWSTQQGKCWWTKSLASICLSLTLISIGGYTPNCDKQYYWLFLSR